MNRLPVVRIDEKLIVIPEGAHLSSAYPLFDALRAAVGPPGNRASPKMAALLERLDRPSRRTPCTAA